MIVLFYYDSIKGKPYVTGFAKKGLIHAIINI